ncbi:GNAT family N-acetyltransferase [Stappia sp. F7233]|uniref:GNAT family N-acetyltransferase n=1 Tax=Stappia albiluteola TaxID=2758565 RepID=A0A839AI57_9HYPH|nr:GNAT family N-acetyltransferase [Stappia albiluteola]MBA5778708.1 GNAT family N-acetyltransferase [Stappia albiluteola]
MDLDLTRRIEEANFNGFPSERIHLDGSWITRISPGNPARRVNSLNFLAREDDASLQERLARSRSQLEAAGEAFHLRWTPLAPQAVTDFCDAAGWPAHGHADVWGLRLADFHNHGAQQADIGITGEPLESWLAAFATIGGTRTEAATPQAVERLGASLARISIPCALLVARSGAGEPVGTAIATLDRDLIGLYDVAVAPAMRRMGLGRALVAACLSVGRDQGSAIAWLQVTAENAAARALYQSMGFVPLYSYHYRSPVG